MTPRLVGWVLFGALAVGLWTAAPAWFAPAPAEPGPRARTRHEQALPLRIGFDRLARERPQAVVGRRDLFAFGPLPTPVPTPTPRPSPSGTPEATPDPTPTPTAPLPALNVRFVGVVENERGLRLAVLLTEGREVLTGRAGEVVANRLKIVHIGLESVDVQEVGSDRVRRLPLKGN